MENSEIHINYFYRVFQSETQKLFLEKELKTISDKPNNTDIEDLIYYAYVNNNNPSKNKIDIYNQVLYKICEDYVILSNSNLTVYPSNVFEFVDLLLDTIQENPYKESFLCSLQFIYQCYLECLGKGYPLLMSSKDDSKKSGMEVVLNSGYEILQFEAINLDAIEQDKIINKMVMMECNNEIGPLPKVAMRVRKDI